ncbi:MAG TPA: hypothetical protein GX708_24755 [Gallicola sp.]|nr:hypothetical protein [Gallicola sp.]
MKQNLEFTHNWLTEEIIKTHFKEKETGVKEQITLSKIDLLRFVQKLVETIERGGN